MNKIVVRTMLPLIFLAVGAHPQTSEQSVEALIKEIFPLPSCTGYEKTLTDKIQALLPHGLKPDKDNLGSLYLYSGKGELRLGLFVDKITPQGNIKVRGTGGFLAQTFEGRPVMIYTANGPKEGVVCLRSGYLEKGGNDGSVFVPGGAVCIPLSWPGAYSHSFIEKIHRSDLEALAGLIVAIVEDW